MKRTALFLALATMALGAAAPAVAAVTVLEEDFEGQGYKKKWTFAPEAAWSQMAQGTNHYMAFEGKNGGTATSNKEIRVNASEQYKITFLYRRGPATVKWGPYVLGQVAAATTWKRASFAKLTQKQERLKFQISVPNTTARFDFDDVLIVRCETAVGPASLGRIRALFR